MNQIGTPTSHQQLDRDVLRAEEWTQSRGQSPLHLPYSSLHAVLTLYKALSSLLSLKSSCSSETC